jgi:hypothetical protein
MRLEALTRAMESYRGQGHALLEKLIDPEAASRIAGQFIAACREHGRSVRTGPQNRTAVRGAAVQVYGNRYPALAAFHWGLTPVMSAVTGLDLLPSYSMFRVYSRGATLRVHRDRPASEHGLSLALACSGDAAWPLEIATDGEEAAIPLLADWGDLPHLAYTMLTGDGLLYRGPTHAHARTTPNPNDSSVHGFMFWVDANGTHANWGYERRPPSESDFD